MAPRKTKAKDDSALLAALRFVSVAQSDHGTPYQTHCRFFNGHCVAFDGVLTAGIPYADEIPACPNTFQFIAALERATGALSLTVLDNMTTVVKTDKFRANIEGLTSADMQYVYPDAAQWPLNDDFRKAAAIAGIFCTEGAQTVHGSAVATRNGSIVGTNGIALIEAWHGIATPPGLIIPMTFVKALDKIKKPITKFGASWDGPTPATFTVWFEDNSWLKTQLFIEPYPNVDVFLSYSEVARPIELPKDFYPALSAVERFSEDGSIYFGTEQICSHKDATKGAIHDCKKLSGVGSYSIKTLRQLEPYMQTVDFTGNERVAVFFGEKIRGCFAKRT